VSFGNRLTMEPDLETALARLFGGRIAEARPDTLQSESAAPGSSDGSLGRRALEHFRQAQRALRDGNWEVYGTELKRVEEALEALAKPP
jgi:uncharacterized membrane protein (UPF0182 family)